MDSLSSSVDCMSSSLAALGRISKKLHHVSATFKRNEPSLRLNVERTVVRADTLAQYRADIEMEAVKKFEQLLVFVQRHVGALQASKDEASRERRRLSTEVAGQIEEDLTATTTQHREQMQQLEAQRQQISVSQEQLDAELATARSQLDGIRRAELEQMQQSQSANTSTVAALRIARVEADGAESRVRDLTNVKRDLASRLQALQAEAKAVEGGSAEGSASTAASPGSKRPWEASAEVPADAQAQHDVVQLKRKIASLRAKLGVQKQILQGETSNPRSTQQVREEYAAELTDAEVARVQAEQQAADEHDAALQAAVLTQAVLGCVWSSLGQGGLGEAAAAVIDWVGKQDGQLQWTAEAAAAIGSEAQAAVDMLVEGGVVQLTEVEGGQVLSWGA